MTQYGHTNTNIYSTRFVTPANALLTTFAGLDKNPDGSIVVLSFDTAVDVTNAGSGSCTKIAMAPCNGTVVAARVTSDTTTDGTNGIAIAITNPTINKTIFANTNYDASPALTANTAATLTVDTTAANIDVTAGDQIKVAFVEAGTVGFVTVDVFIQPD